MRMFVSIMICAVLGTACSAPVPRSVAEPVNVPSTDYDADAPTNDDVCISMDAFDRILEVANRPAPTCENPGTEIIVVPTECPDVTVTCEPEVVEVEVEVPAECPEPETCEPEVVVPAECPEPEVCEPQIVEVEVRQPSFAMLDSPIAVDPSTKPERFRFLDVVLIGGERDVRAIFLGFVLQRFDVASGYDYGTWRNAETCAVFDCESILMYRVFDDGTYAVVLDAFDMGAEAYSWYTFSTPTTWGHDLAADARDYFSLYARVREDAPPGRYKLTLSQYEVMHGETRQTIIGPRTVVGFPNNGSEFTVAEEAPEPKTCRSQPSTRVWGLAPANDAGTDVYQRVFVAEVKATNCDVFLDAIEIGARGIVDYDGYGGEEQAMFTNLDVLAADLYATARLDSAPADERSTATLEPVEGLSANRRVVTNLSIPAGDSAIVEVYLKRGADAQPGKYLFSLEAVSSRHPESDSWLEERAGMPRFGIPFAVTE